MKALIVGAHTDDAIFSLGDLIVAGEFEFTIASVMAGIPDDEVGNAKHTRLLEEHRNACKAIGAEYVNGPFLDDVYGLQPTREVYLWLWAVMEEFDYIFVPVGIHHPDHLLVHSCCQAALQHRKHVAVYYYEELPYFTDYPEETASRVERLQFDRGPLKLLPALSTDPVKVAAAGKYASQVDPSVLERILVPERIWK